MDNQSSTDYLTSQNMNQVLEHIQPSIEANIELKEQVFPWFQSAIEQRFKGDTYSVHRVACWGSLERGNSIFQNRDVHVVVFVNYSGCESRVWHMCINHCDTCFLSHNNNTAIAVQRQEEEEETNELNDNDTIVKYTVMRQWVDEFCEKVVRGNDCARKMDRCMRGDDQVHYGLLPNQIKYYSLAKNVTFHVSLVPSGTMFQNASSLLSFSSDETAKAMYALALAESRNEYLLNQTQSTDVKKLVRMVKYWVRCECNNNQELTEYFLEVLAVQVRSNVQEQGSDVRWESLFVEYMKELYNMSRDALVSEPVLMDPLLATLNIAREVRNWSEIRRSCAKTLKHFGVDVRPDEDEHGGESPSEEVSTSFRYNSEDEEYIIVDKVTLNANT